MENNIQNSFDDIRPLRDDEVEATIEKITSDIYFRQTVVPYIETATWKNLIQTMKRCKTVYDFQRTITSPILLKLFDVTQTKINSSNWNFTKGERSQLYISNHRDIVLDAAILNILMLLNKRETVEIAIGDNLLFIPWVADIVRLNKSFIVKRNLPIKQLLEEINHLSAYISQTIIQRNQSIWIAQREGRAKDANDRTQISVLKMLSLYNKRNPLEALTNLNIVPISLSYEYDPCDYLKAKESQMKRDNPEHKKTFFDDVENMKTGIMGYKGRVHLQFGRPINDKLEKLDRDMDKTSIFSSVASIIDREIHLNYLFFTHNYIAYDLMTDSHTFMHKYSMVDRNNFEKYITKQVDKIEVADKDEAFLRSTIILMYGNTLKNYLEALEK
ncbi:MAG: 1-acyl-sn-glycerol-3-phosphate acyltransferase [Proteiniphilum sp.]|jgi:hypothetical protein|nr:1-acyl-sn-glycerol-3-phosphate acyltransferase [Proteiniphilum sp.]